jgi:acetyl esterase/lipase
MRSIALGLSLIVTLAAAACAALIVLPAPVKGLALLAFVVEEKPFVLVGAALLGALFARWSGSGPWRVIQTLLALAIIALSLIPPSQAIRMATGKHVALDLLRYLRAPIDTGAARPAQTIVYATVDGQPLALDVYPPVSTSTSTSPAESRTPAVIVIHGGGWSADDKGGAPLASAWLAAHGFAVFDIQYRTAPQPNWRTATGDVKCAIGWVKRHAMDKAGVNIDPARVTLLGRSAGGHLALLAAYAPDDPALPPTCQSGDTRVASVISLYGPTDLTWSFEHPLNPRIFDSPVRLANFLGGTPTTVPERYRLMSPTNRVTPQAPRTLLIHGGHDQFVSVSHANLLAARLSAANVPHELLIIPYAEHAFDFIQGGLAGQLAEHAILQFLDRVP